MNVSGKKNRSRFVALGLTMACALLVVVGAGLFFSTRYINQQMLLANQNNAVDIATIINNNFSVTDDEADYLKTRTFTEMETDPINLRLMDTVTGLPLNQKITNIYVFVPLTDSEIKYTTDEKTAQFFGYGVGTKLNGMWLMNGTFDADQKFVAATRDDIYRYFELSNNDINALDKRQAFGHVTEDAWGKFITGYAPLYSAQGTFIGILGVDMDMNLYYTNALGMTATLVFAYLFIIAVLLALTVLFFMKYMKAKEGVLYYDFYSRLSHDMRTPMNGILGIAALSKGEQDPAALQEDIEKMESSGEYLLALINDSLDFKKMQSGKLELHPEIVDTRAMIRDIESMVGETAKAKNIRFETKQTSALSDAYIYADGIRLKQIFVNLLSNAVKFTPDGGMVAWLIGVQSRDGMVSHSMITVKDSGIGMSEDFIKHKLFTPFAQEYNATTAKYASTGLGLSIVKNLVEQMGGRIEVESEQGEGTTFTVYLDLEKVEDAEAEKKLAGRVTEAPQISDALRGTHILVAEDHPLNAEIAKRLLEKYGCKVSVAANGELAVQSFAQSPVNGYDAVLMDIRMPVMDGLEATKQIRALAREDARTVPIIAMTANAYEEDRKKTRDAGMNEHLAKPIDPKALYDALAICIHKG